MTFYDTCRKQALALFLFVMGGAIVAPAAQAQEELSVLQDWVHYAEASNASYHHLSRQAFERLRRRAEAVDALHTRAQWQQRQEKVRKTLRDIVGPFPERTPLNARVTGTIEKDGYHVEKLVYESMPGFYVTAALFVPAGLQEAERQEKAPAILYASGHADVAFRSQTYQHVILNLVRKGFVVLAFDPVGQGERLQYVDPQTGQSRVGGNTNQHSYSGAQAFVAGSSLARYMIWDGMRGIDYLASREEVDPERIGVTGRSGGGTQSAYIAAFDERVQAAAPENYITSFQRLLETRGPQDAEQNFYHGIVRGIDHADLLEVRAPKPTLMITTTRDIFSIQGARETYREVKRAYEAFEQPGHLQMVEDDAGHASTRSNREALYAFFQKHLDLPGPAEDEEVAYLPPAALQVTESGQVSTSLNGESIFSLNRAKTKKLAAELEASRQKGLPEHLSSAKRSAQKLSGYEAPQRAAEEAGAATSVFFGRYQREGYAVEKYTVQGEGDYVVPLLMLVPEGEGPHPAVVYLHPGGKAAGAAPGGEMEAFVEQGYVVLAPDMLGTGELGGGAFKGDSYIEEVSYGLWFETVLLGRSLTGIRAGDVMRTVQLLKSRADVKSETIAAVAREEAAPVALHAAAFEPALAGVALIEPLVSYRSLATERYYDPAFIPTAVAGALTGYDLPDLAASLAPRKLLMVNPVSGSGSRAGTDLIEKELSVVRSAYARAEARERLKVQRTQEDQPNEEVSSAEEISSVLSFLKSPPGTE